jgi:hypothetical protein
MNIPQTVTATGVATQVISSVRSVLLYASISNTGGSPLLFVLVDQPSVPTIGSSNAYTG